MPPARKSKRGLSNVALGIGAVLALTAPLGADVSDADFPADRPWLPIVVEYPDGQRPSGLLPLEVSVILPASLSAPGPDNLALLHHAGEDRWNELAFELHRVSRTDRVGEGERPHHGSWTGRLTFFPPADAPSPMELRLSWGAGGSNAVFPDPPTTTGDGPDWTINTGALTVKLHQPSGQLGAVTVLAEQQTPITTDRDILHWNPDIFSATRPWSHAHRWDPPPHVDKQGGALTLAVTRRGTFPNVPEAELLMRYRFFADRPFVESVTEVHVREDLPVVSLRNDQLIFPGDFFSDVLWIEDADQDAPIQRAAFADLTPVNRHGDVLRLAPDLPLLVFASKAKNLAVATVRAEASNQGPDGTPPVLFDHATYIANRPDGLQYWFRPLVYFNVEWSREHRIRIPAGSVYRERNYYVFHAPDQTPPIELPRRLLRESQLRPDVRIGPYEFPASRP